MLQPAKWRKKQLIIGDRLFPHFPKLEKILNINKSECYSFKRNRKCISFLTFIIHLVIKMFLMYTPCSVFIVQLCQTTVNRNMIQPIKPQALTSSSQVDDQTSVENGAASQSLGGGDRVHRFQTQTHLRTETFTLSADEPTQIK